MVFHDTSSEAYNRVKSELLDGEKLLWMKQTPGKTWRSRASLIAIPIIGILAGACFFYIGWVLCLLLELGFLIPLWIIVWHSNSQIYVITDRRLFFMYFNGLVESYSPQSINSIQRRDKTGGSGHLILQAGGEDLGLYDIDNVREVEALLIETFYIPPGDAQDISSPPPPHWR